MRVHFSSVVTIFIALSLVSGTVGCRSNGGPWYNPGTYAFSSPFGKDRQTSPHSSSMANKKPSLDAQPNISTPHGGYTDSSSFAASPASTGGTVSSTPPAHWAAQQSPMTQQNSPNSYGGYTTVADPSQYSPQTYAEAYGGQGSHATPSQHQQAMVQGQQSPYHYPQESVQQAHSFPAVPYGEQYAQTGYHTTSVYQQQPMNNVQDGTFGTMTQPSMEQPGQYGSPGAMYSNDPYAGTLQSSNALPSGFGQEQAAPSSYGYPGEGVSVASPYQPYQPPPASGAYSY